MDDDNVPALMSIGHPGTFVFPGAARAFAQRAVVGGRIFVGSQGAVCALSTL